MVSKFDTEIFLNHHSIVFRIIDDKNKYGIDAFYLLYLFSHELTQKQLFNKVMIDTTLPNIGNRWEELNLPISKDKNQREEIKRKIREIFDKRWEAEEEIHNMKKKYGNLTT